VAETRRDNLIYALSTAFPHSAFHAVVEMNCRMPTSVSSRFVRRSLWNKASRTRFPRSFPSFSRFVSSSAALLILVVWYWTCVEINQ
jgi:hypothetical protein